METTTEQETGRPLREAVAMRRWSVISIVVVVTAVAIGLSYQQTPSYTSEARVLVRLSEPTITTEGEDINLETERELGESPAVAEIAADELPAGEVPDDPSRMLDDLTVELLEDTEILEFAVSNEDAEVAQDRANAFAAGYIAFRRQRLEEAAATRTAGVEREIRILNRRLDLVNRRITQTTNPARLARLQGQENTLLSILLDKELQRVELTNVPSVGAIIKPAELPRRPSSPNHVVDSVLGLVLGLLLGFGYAAFRSQRDERHMSVERFESRLGSQVLGVVPRFSVRRKQAPLIGSDRSDPWMEEAYRILRTNVLSVATARDLRTILVTSARPAEGKTVTTANLATVMAASGRRVILVSADLRNHRLTELFERPTHPGLTDVLGGGASIDSALVSIRQNLRLLPGGSHPFDPASLLGSKGMADVLGRLEKEADIVLIDSAPLLGMADSVALAPMVDGVLLVIDGRTSTPGPLGRARKQLDRVGALLMGAVLNQYEGAKAEGYAAYKGYASASTVEPPIPAEESGRAPTLS